MSRPLLAVVLACAISFLVACDPEPDPPPPAAALEGTCWQLAEIHHSILADVHYPEPDAAPCKLVLCFEADGRYRATGCNTCTGSYVPAEGVANEVVELRSRTCTERTCVPPCTPGETEVLDVPTFAERSGSRLILDSHEAAGHEIYVFDPRP